MWIVRYPAGMTILQNRLWCALLVGIAMVGSISLPRFSAMAQSTNPNAEVEALVRAAFADAPAMIAVAKCESGFRQFSAPGVVLRGGTAKGYIGIFQISEQLHAATAKAAGMDITTIEGNLAYARQLYNKSGLIPWRDCLPSDAIKTQTLVVAAPSIAVLTIDLRVSMQHAQVRTLQQLLNAQGFAVAASGAGAPGQETTLFGALTRAAVQRFQCARQIVCEGNETTTGYGKVGPKTRAALLAGAKLQ